MRAEDPERFRWVDSYEGLPVPAELSGEAAAGWRDAGHDRLERAAVVLPGLALAGVLALAADAGVRGLAGALGLAHAPLSPILVAVLLGLALRNSVGLPEAYAPGLRLCSRRVLQVGVALLGLRLSLASVGTIGALALPVVAVCIALALVLVTRLGRALALPRRLALLIAVGTSICGNSAVVATAPVIGARDDEVSYAVACVTLFGLLALLVHPFLARALFDADAVSAGIFLGTAIHDTSQVAGAGLVYAQLYGDAAALDTAVVTKLVRNLFLLAVIPAAALLHRRSGGAGGGRRPPLRSLVPGFVFAFLALTALRTLGDLGEPAFGLLSGEAWRAFVGGAGRAAELCLAVAMAAVGLSTSAARLRILGLRPLAVGMAAAALVGLASAGLIHLVPTGLVPGAP